MKRVNYFPVGFKKPITVDVIYENNDNNYDIRLPNGKEVQNVPRLENTNVNEAKAGHVAFFDEIPYVAPVIPVSPSGDFVE